MRTISQDLLDELDSTRTIGARVEFRKTLLSFTTHISNGDSGIIASVKNWDNETVNSGASILRVANVGDVLYYQYASDPTATSWGSWTSSGRNLRTDSKVSLSGTRVFYHGNNNMRYYANFTLSPLSLGSATAIGSSIDDDLAMAPIDTTHFYQLLNTYGTTMPVGKISQHSTDGSGIGTWHGRVYGPNDYYRYFDAVAIGDERYVFFVDQDEKRVMYIKGTVVEADGYTVFSNAKPLIELDAYDDNNKLQLSAVTVIDGKIFVTGILNRTNGYATHIYTMGPEPFTMGRDQYITNVNVYSYKFGGKLHLIGNKMYYIGPNMNQWADATTLVGYDNTSLKLDTASINELTTSESTNGSMRIGFRANTTHSGSNAIVGGGEAKVYVSVGGQEDLLNTIGIDQIVENTSPEGANYAISGRGNAIKRMTDWNADASYDMWSQTKIDTNFSSPTGDWVRYSGQWQKDTFSGYYATTGVNVGNILYTACRPARNATIEVEFTKTQPTEYDARWGVMLNFYSGDYDDEDSGYSGIALIMADQMYGDDGPGAELYKIIDGTWTQLLHNHFGVPGSDPHWLMLSFNDGEIGCYYRNSANTNWLTLFVDTWEEADQPPWFSDRYEGRGAIYTETVTPHATASGFDSISDVIPVADNSDFPSSDASGLIIDSERIQYTGKSPNYTITPLQVVDMVTWGAAPHDVTESYWDDGIVYQRDIGTTESDQPLSTTNDNGYFQRSFFNNSAGKIRYIRARAKKVGAPTGNLYCYLVTDDWDNTSPPSQGAVIAYGSVTPGSVGTSYDWYTFDLGALYSVDIDNYWIVFANVAPPNSPSVQPTNYYVIGVDEDITTEDEGLTRVWGSVSGWYSRSTDAVIPMVAVGYNNNGDGYEIYLYPNGTAVDRWYYDNCALVFYDDANLGHSYKITDYDYQAPDQWVPSQTYEPPDRWQDHVGDLSHGSWVTPNARRIFVDKNPSGIIKKDMIVHVKPALYGLTRGWVDTTATAHAFGSIVSIYENSSVQLISGRYMSGELDMSWEDVATNIARKAGVISVTAEKSASGAKVHEHLGWSLNSDMNNYEFERKYNFVARFQPTSTSSQEIGIWYGVQGYTSNWHDGFIVTIDTDPLTPYVQLYTVTGTTPALTERYIAPNQFFRNNWITISTQIIGQFKICSVWANDKFIKSFVTFSDTVGNAGFVSYGDANFNADWPALDMHVDNFVIDIGKSAYSLMERLIGDKQCFIRDHESGGLYLYQNRDSISTPTYNYITDKTEIYRDIDTVTKLRLEGAEAIETYDSTLMKNYGIVFRSLNAPEIRNWYDALNQVQYMMAEMKARRHAYAISGMCDPRIQANDIITISGPTNIVIDAINTNLTVNEAGAEYDMKLEGYNAS